MDATPSLLVLPFLEIEVSAFLNEQGRPYVALAPLSRLLGLNHTYEMRRLQHIGLHDQLLAFTTPPEPPSRRIWTLDYPIGLTNWLGYVYPRITQTQWTETLKQFVNWGMNIQGQAFTQVQQDFAQMRHLIYRLSALLVTYESRMQPLRNLASQASSDQQARLHQLDADWQAILHPARAFLQRWLAEKNNLPVVETIVVQDGIVAPETQPVTLFGTISRQDRDTVYAYVTDLSSWSKEFSATLNDLTGGNNHE